MNIFPCNKTDITDKDISGFKYLELIMYAVKMFKNCICTEIMGFLTCLQGLIENYKTPLPI